MHYVRVYQFNCGCAFIPALIGIEWVAYCQNHPPEKQLKLPFNEEKR